MVLAGQAGDTGGAVTTSATQFVAVVSKVQTLADGGLRVTLDLSEDMTLQAAELMEYKRWGVLAEVNIGPTVINRDEQKTGAILEKRRKRQSEWATAEQSGADRDT